MGRDECRFGGCRDVDLKFVGSERRGFHSSDSGTKGDGLGNGPKPTVCERWGDGTRSIPKGTKVLDEFRFFHSELVVEEVEKLFLHQVNLGEREESGVFLPVHVFRRRVVEVFGGTDEHGEEDSVTCACKT